MIHTPIVHPSQVLLTETLPVSLRWNRFSGGEFQSTPFRAVRRYDLTDRGSTVWGFLGLPSAEDVGWVTKDTGHESRTDRDTYRRTVPGLSPFLGGNGEENPSFSSFIFYATADFTWKRKIKPLTQSRKEDYSAGKGVKGSERTPTK